MLSVQCEYCHSRIFPNERRCMTCGAPPPVSIYPEQAKIKPKAYRQVMSTAAYIGTANTDNIVFGTTIVDRPMESYST